jgi:hypothetical protein
LLEKSLTKLKGEKGIYRGRVIYALVDYRAIIMQSGHVSTRIERVPINISTVALRAAKKKRPSSIRALEPNEKIESSSALNAPEIVTVERLIPEKIWHLILFISKPKLRELEGNYWEIIIPYAQVG